MEQLAQQLKGDGIDLAWWPAFFSSYQADYVEAPAIQTGPKEGTFTQSLHALFQSVNAAESCDFEETLP